MYQPETLPKLPRPACPYQVACASGANMKARKCNAPAGASGWCCQHEYVQEILELDYTLGFPDYIAALLNKRPCITISRGAGNWELYATHHMRLNHTDLVQRLRADVQAWHNMEPLKAS